MMTIQKPKRMWQKKKDYNKKRLIRKIQRRNKTSFDDGKDRSYEDWKTKISKYKHIDIDHDNTFDYEGFYNSDPDNAYRFLNGDPAAHFDDTYKTVYHPTFSDLSIYSGKVDPRFNPKGLKGGHWVNDHKYLSPKQSPVSMDERIGYLGEAEDNGVQLRTYDNQPIWLNDGTIWAGVLPQVVVTPENHNSGKDRSYSDLKTNRPIIIGPGLLSMFTPKPKGYKEGKDCFDIGTDNGQQIIYQDGDQYFAGPSESAATIKVTPYIQRLPNDKSTWDFVDDSGKLYTTKYSDDQLKQLYGQNVPASEFYNWTDRSGKEHRQMRIIPVSPVDPIGEIAVETALGYPLFKGMSLAGGQLLKDYARDFAFTKLGNWARNKIAGKEAANILNKSVDSWNSVVNSNLIQNKNILYNPNNTKWSSTFTDFYKYPDALKYYEDYPEALDQLKSLKSWVNTTKRDISDITLYNTPKWDSNGQGAYLGEIDYNNIISPYVDNIMRPNFKRFGIPENLQFTDKMYLTRLPKGIGGAVTNYGKYIADPINSRNLNSTVLHELGSHGTDAFISPSMQNIYDISKYLTHVRIPGSKLWYETRATKNEVGKKIFDALDNKSKKAFDLAIDNMSDKDVIRKFSGINSYGDDIFYEYFQHTPEIQKEMVDKIRYMLKYAPGLLPVLPFIRHTTQQQNHNSGKDIHIKKANRGKFTEAANEHNMGVQEFARQVLSAPKGKYSSTLRKRANFARNFAH